MLAAKLNRLIDIESLSEGSDALGTPTQTWSLLQGNVKCEVRQNDGTKKFDGDIEGNVHAFNTIFIFRYLESFGYNCRIKYSDEIYEILSINDYGRVSPCRVQGHKVITKRRVNNG